uniref:Biotin carboxyl carrier protein of acetyl-CoA carboxylase n=1 Tax=Pleonosporium borreri TaxID=2575635 RepID=A0A4D6WW67_9FLOR|nr:acetyl-CoA carboxylase, biotin carboxyl carrier protein [Pleonosporium borreri]
MLFTLKQLHTFLNQTNNYNLDQINIKSNNCNITINKNYQNKYQRQKLYKSTKINTHIKSATSTKTKYLDNNQNKKTIALNESETYYTIISPMVGTFYRSPAPNEPVFIEKHDTVEKKQTVCIIEAMKLMNEIEAEVNGEVVEILVKDGDIVDCGQALMKVKNI